MDVASALGIKAQRVPITPRALAFLRSAVSAALNAQSGPTNMAERGCDPATPGGDAHFFVIDGSGSAIAFLLVDNPRTWAPTTAAAHAAARALAEPSSDVRHSSARRPAAFDFSCAFRPQRIRLLPPESAPALGANSARRDSTCRLESLPGWVPAERGTARAAARALAGDRAAGHRHSAEQRTMRAVVTATRTPRAGAMAEAEAA
eukprot:2474137-Pleurochrysis_carterae.AAC.3